MNWKNIKSFLIILFTLINILLIVNTVNLSKAYILSDADISNTVLLLEKNNINIDKKIIPSSAKKYDNIHLTDLAFSDENMMDKFNIIQSNDGNIIMKFKSDEISNQKNTEKFIYGILKDNNFNVKDIKLYKKTSDGLKYEMTSYYDGLEIYDNHLDITVNDASIEFYGKWYTYDTEIINFAQKNNIVYATSALAEFISVKPDTDKKITITDISIGYKSLQDDSTNNIKTIAAVPCYRLTTDKGLVYYYNIRNGKFMTD